MTLVKTKKRTTSNQRKMTASHHRKSQRYLKPYWPYIPIAIILSGSAIANTYLPASLNNSYVNNPSGARINSVVGGTNEMLVVVLSIVLVILVAWFAVRHFKRIKKLALEGEHLLARNYILDIAAALIIAGLYVLVR